MTASRKIMKHYIDVYTQFIQRELERLGDKMETRPVEWKITDKGLTDKIAQLNANLKQFTDLDSDINASSKARQEPSAEELMALENAMMACANIASHRRQESRNKFINGATTALSLGIVRWFKPNGFYGLSDSMVEYMKLGSILKNSSTQAPEQKSDSAGAAESKGSGVAPVKKSMLQLRLENVYDVSIQSPAGRHTIVGNNEDGLKVAEDYNQFRAFSAKP